MIDTYLKPWLLEVNQNPSLSGEQGVDKEVKPDLVSDMFNLIRLEPLAKTPDAVAKVTN